VKNKGGFGTCVQIPLIHLEQLALGGCIQLEDLPSSIVATCGANPVWHHLFFAIGTLHQMRQADCIVGAATIAATFAYFTLW
jgi:hypothetical protein